MSSPIGLVLHGGAGDSWIGDSNSHRTTQVFLEELVRNAETSLHAGARAVDVCASVVASLEDFPEFNAGKGSAVNIRGYHELEAGIVDGDSGKYRAAVCLEKTKNPVRLVRAMLESHDGSDVLHGADVPVLIAGVEGDNLAGQMGLEAVPNDYFTTERRMSYFKKVMGEPRAARANEHGTVGAVVLDKYGCLAAANSTGGTTFKAVGRVGDTAILGCGLYADKHVAVACSGGGESILTAMLASRVAQQYQNNGNDLAAAVETAMWEATKLCPALSCGVVAISADGSQTAQCNSRIFTIAAVGGRPKQDRPVPTGLLPCTMQIIAPLCFHEDRVLRVGMCRYPTRSGQVTFQTHHLELATMNSDQFWTFFRLVRRIAMSMMAASRAQDVAIVIAPGGRTGHLFPVHHDHHEDAVETQKTYVAAHSQDSVIIKSQSLEDDEQRPLFHLPGFLAGPESQFRGVVGALWDALELAGGLREALQYEHSSSAPWAIRQMLKPALDGIILEATPHRDPYWPKPAPAGTGGLTSALGPKVRDAGPLHAMAAQLRDALNSNSSLRDIHHT